MTTPVVLITGALTGIGRATALAFAEEGARIVVSGRRDEAGHALTQELRSLGDKRIKFIGFDDDQAVLDDIKDGFAFGTYLQNSYGQAYLGAYALDLLASKTCTIKDDAPWDKSPQTAHFIDSGVLKVTADNLATAKDAMKQMATDIQSKFKATYLNCK